MAATFIALGLKGANHIIDKHFEKVPDKAFHRDRPYILSDKKSRPEDQNSGSQGENSSKGSASRGLSPDRDRGFEEEDSDYEDHPTVEEAGSYDQRGSHMGTYPGPPPPGVGGVYSREPPKLRQQYIPPAAMAAASEAYFPPPPSQPWDDGYGGQKGDRNDDDRNNSRRDSGRGSRRDKRSDNDRRGSRRREDDDDDERTSSYVSSSGRSSRPKAVSRRSNSHPGFRSSKYSDDEDEEGQSRASSSRRYNSGSQHVDRALDRAHRYKVKDEIRNSLTDSKTGLAGSAVGALVGGWAASKAQVAYDKGGKKGDSNALLTLLGAALGGVAVNAVVEKYEESKGTKNVPREMWEEKIEKKPESECGSESDSGSESDRGHRSRRNNRGRVGDKRKKRSSQRRDRGYDSG